MASKLGRPAVSTSIKKGQKLALGNDKTQRLSTWIDRELSRSMPAPDDTVQSYEDIVSKRQALAEKLVDTALKTRDDSIRLAYIKEIADRTEGRPQQSVDVTSLGKAVGSMSVQEAADRLDELG